MPVEFLPAEAGNLFQRVDHHVLVDPGNGVGEGMVAREEEDAEVVEDEKGEDLVVGDAEKAGDHFRVAGESETATTPLIQKIRN